jgi:hypothetical protein
VVLASFSLLYGSASNAAAHDYAYSVKQQDEDEVIRLYDRASEQTVWTEKVHDHSSLAWSPDQRGICIGVTTLSNSPSILVWREGSHEAVVGYDDDYMLRGIVWSPDCNRVLFRTGFSGDVDVNLGSLRCLNLQTLKISTKDKGVRKMIWTSPRHVLYFPGEWEGSVFITAKKPKSWCPP